MATTRRKAQTIINTPMILVGEPEGKRTVGRHKH